MKGSYRQLWSLPFKLGSFFYSRTGRRMLINFSSSSPLKGSHAFVSLEIYLPTREAR